jgi:putative PIN family toxin of toxin-antitoxin system
MAPPSHEPPLTLVLDTNVVIDWLVFDDAFMAPLRDGIVHRQIRVLTHAPAIVELQRVVGYPALKLSAERQLAIVTAYLAQTIVPSLPQGFSLTRLLTPIGFPQCRDPDDQHFLALAFHARARALVSRDKAVLQLRRRARKFAVDILNVPEMIAQLRISPAATSQAAPLKPAAS